MADELVKRVDSKCSGLAFLPFNDSNEFVLAATPTVPFSVWRSIIFNEFNQRVNAEQQEHIEACVKCNVMTDYMVTLSAHDSDSDFERWMKRRVFFLFIYRHFTGIEVWARIRLGVREAIAAGHIPGLDKDPFCACVEDREQSEFDGVHPRICLRSLTRALTVVATMGFQYREDLNNTELEHLRERLKLIYLYIGLLDEWIVELGGSAKLLDEVKSIMDDPWHVTAVDAYTKDNEPQHMPSPFTDFIPATSSIVHMTLQEEVDLLKDYKELVCKMMGLSSIDVLLCDDIYSGVDIIMPINDDNPSLGDEDYKEQPRAARAAELDECEHPYSDVWHSKVEYRAFECCKPIEELPAPPYPFQQRWARLSALRVGGQRKKQRRKR